MASGNKTIKEIILSEKRFIIDLLDLTKLNVLVKLCIIAIEISLLSTLVVFLVFVTGFIIAVLCILVSRFHSLRIILYLLKKYSILLIRNLNP